MTRRPAALYTVLALAFAVGALTDPRSAARAQDAPLGAAVFSHWCAPCHAAGPGHPGTQALAAKYNGDKADELAMRTDLTPQLIKYFVRHGVSVMPFFRKTEISDDELDALAAWLARASAPSD